MTTPQQHLKNEVEARTERKDGSNGAMRKTSTLQDKAIL